MPKCSMCKKDVRDLVPYGKMLLCDYCLKETREQNTGKLDTGRWLIRTTDGLILGPYDQDSLRALISDKKVVFLDEVSRDGQEWGLIKNIALFKDLALKTDYKLSESTVDVELKELGKAKPQKQRTETRPPRFKKEVRIPISLPTLPYIQSIWKRPLFAIVSVAILVSGFGIFYLGKNRGSASITEQKYSSEESDYFNKYYIKGREYEEGGLFKDALEYYKKALSAAPNHSGVRIRKAAIDLMVLSNQDAASRSLQELYSEANIGKITDQEEQCDIKTFLGLLEVKKSNLQSAMGYFNQALSIKPTNAYLYYDMGRIMFKQQNYIGALEYFRNAKKLSSSFSDAALYEGLCMLKLNRFKEAASIFADAQSQNPNMRELYILAAYAYLRSSGVSKAYAVIKRVLTIDPYYFDREFTPLYQLPKDDLVSEEIAYTNEIIKNIDPKSRDDALCALSILYMVKGSFDESIKILSNIKKDSSNKLTLLGIIYFHQRKYDDAKAKIDKSLEMDYSNNIAHLYAGEIALKDNDIGQARNHFTKAQSADEETSLYAMTLLGDVYLKTGEQNSAIILWKKVLSYDTKYTPAWERILNVNN